MKIILLGNAGAGKSTLAKKLIGGNPVPRLSLDEIAFAGSAERRALAESIADVETFIRAHPSWIIEGCYSDIIAPFLSECDELIFLNPGVDACITHCRKREWEPEKFSNKEEQDAHLDKLIHWVTAYETREDEYGLKSHRALFDAFRGKKREYRDPKEYE